MLLAPSCHKHGNEAFSYSSSENIEGIERQCHCSFPPSPNTECLHWFLLYWRITLCQRFCKRSGRIATCCCIFLNLCDSKQATNTDNQLLFSFSLSPFLSLLQAALQISPKTIKVLPPEVKQGSVVFRQG